MWYLKPQGNFQVSYDVYLLVVKLGSLRHTIGEMVSMERSYFKPQEKPSFVVVCACMLREHDGPST